MFVAEKDRDRYFAPVMNGLPFFGRRPTGRDPDSAPTRSRPMGRLDGAGRLRVQSSPAIAVDTSSFSKPRCNGR
jgi:hypothetical protein